MTGLKLKDWVMDRFSKAKVKEAVSKVRLNNLTVTMQTIVGRLKIAGTSAANWLKRVSERSRALLMRSKNGTARRSWKTNGWRLTLSEKLRTYRMHMYGSLGAIGILLAGSLGIQGYIKAHTVEVYQVYVKDELAGTVSSPQVVDQFKIKKIEEIQEKNPNIHMVLNTDEVVLRSERVYKGKGEDAATLQRLDQMLTAHSVGVELVVDDKVIGVVKDKDTADLILNQIKSKFAGADASDQQKDKAIKVSVLSFNKTLNPGESETQEVGFVQKVDVKSKNIDPGELMDPKDVLNKLETGDVQPTKYTVEKGDSISKIAKKFGISRQVIYENNPWIADDMIKAGQVLDLTVLQPTLSVKTVEKVVEQQEIQYDTDYVKDDSLKAGVVQTISSGKNGLKNVTFLVTKVNGKMMDEEMLNEEILQQPQKAVAKKGTKVIIGEGTGKFAWPVLGSSVTSGFGYRWGKLHKGVDLSGNRSILAADNGKVEYTGYKDDYGNHVIITHMNGYKTLYGHLSSINVKVGQVVEKGEKIGVMGSTGDSTGVHLHFEIMKNGSVENPLKYLNK